MQVVGANRAVKSLEVSTDSGKSWKAGVRQPYNFFEISSGTGTSKVDVRIVSDNGKVMVVPEVQISSDMSVTAKSNF